MVISIACSSETARTMDGIVALPACLEAIRPPFAGDELVLPGTLGRVRTTMGCTTPLAAMDFAQARSACRRRNWVRVWNGLRSMVADRNLKRLAVSRRGGHASAAAAGA